MGWHDQNYILICTGNPEDPSEPVYTDSLDGLAHEFTHGVVAHSANFDGSHEAAALNEAFSDLFAAFIDDDDPWRITRVPGNKVNIGKPEYEDIRRNIEDPNCENQPAENTPYQQECIKPSVVYPTHYNDRYCDGAHPTGINCRCPKRPGGPDIPEESNTNCSHLNSLVFSHAAFLANQAGVSRAKLQHIYYYALTNEFVASISTPATFKTAARAIHDSCIRLQESENNYDINNNDCTNIDNALVSVGIYTKKPNTSNPFLIPQFPEVKGLFTDTQILLRDWADNLIGDTRLKIEEFIEQSLDQLIETLDAEFEALIQRMLEVLSQLLVESMQNCCLGGTLITIIPLAILLGKRKHF